MRTSGRWTHRRQECGLGASTRGMGRCPEHESRQRPGSGQQSCVPGAWIHCGFRRPRWPPDCAGSFARCSCPARTETPGRVTQGLWCERQPRGSSDPRGPLSLPPIRSPAGAPLDRGNAPAGEWKGWRNDRWRDPAGGVQPPGVDVGRGMSASILTCAIGALGARGNSEISAGLRSDHNWRGAIAGQEPGSSTRLDGRGSAVGGPRWRGRPSAAVQPSVDGGGVSADAGVARGIHTAAPSASSRAR